MRYGQLQRDNVQDQRRVDATLLIVVAGGIAQLRAQRLSIPVLAGVMDEAGLGADLGADQPARAGEEVEAAAVGLVIGWAAIEARVVLVHAHRVCNSFPRHFLSKASHT